MATISLKLFAWSVMITLKGSNIFSNCAKSHQLQTLETIILSKLAVVSSLKIFHAKHEPPWVNPPMLKIGFLFVCFVCLFVCLFVLITNYYRVPSLFYCPNVCLFVFFVMSCVLPILGHLSRLCSWCFYSFVVLLNKVMSNENENEILKKQTTTTTTTKINK